MRNEEIAARLRAVDCIESTLASVDGIAEQLAAASHWRPGRGLQAQCQEAVSVLHNLQERLERKLVVSIIGPTGSGKSTLLDALSGCDGLSEVGEDRPTTRGVIVFCGEPADAEPLIQELGRENVRVVSSPAAAVLQHVILVDTPDTDSKMCPEHHIILKRLVQHSDVLLCLFNSENPKRCDHIDFLAPVVALFPNESLFAVLTQRDRRPKDELSQTLLPAFKEHLESAWGRKPGQYFCISARAHLQAPRWDQGAEPRHEVNEYDGLRSTVFDSLNRGVVVVDSRLRQAHQIQGLIEKSVWERLNPHHAGLQSAAQSITALKREALATAVRSMKSDSLHEGRGVDLMLYQRLAQLWWGPVGWLVALWARFLVFGAGVVNILHFRNLIRQLVGIVSTALRYRRSKQALEEATSSRLVKQASLKFRSALQCGWIDIGNRLVDAGYDATVLDARQAMEPEAKIKEKLGELWESELGGAIETSAQRLSHWPIQVVVNLPVLIVLCFAMFQCVSAFWRADYFSGDYFRHAAVTIILVWLLSFVVLQVLVRRLGSSRVLETAMANLLGDAAFGALDGRPEGIEAEVHVLCSLASALDSKGSQRRQFDA
jgi:energy-coupling factor transporter ATP-binding protein EcfA2